MISLKNMPINIQPSFLKPKGLVSLKNFSLNTTKYSISDGDKKFGMIF